MSGHLSPNFVLPGPLSSEDMAYAVHTLTLNSFAASLSLPSIYLQHFSLLH